ncbi:hypothetical protein D9M71_441890 [compost metagenome]
MLPIRNPCCRAKACNSAPRASSPSSLRMFTSVAAGCKPARRVRSQAASTCPARCMTPPGSACTGKMCPGWTRSLGLLPGSTATWIERARSAAEIPVDTPVAASIERVKPNPLGALELGTIKSRPSTRQRCSVKARQIRPRACTAMKVTASASACSAAISKEPSPLCSSSVMTTFSPARRASISCGTLSNCTLPRPFN